MYKFALISRVDFSQPKCSGRLKSTLLANINFNAFNITPKGQRLLNNNFNQEQLAKIIVWQKELSNTNHFDLELDAIIDRLLLTIKNKKAYKNSCEAPINAFFIHGNELEVWANDIFDYGNRVYYNLHFASEKKAYNAFRTLRDDKDMYSINKDPFHIVKWSVDSTKFLNKSYDYMYKEPCFKREIESLPNSKPTLLSRVSRIISTIFRDRD